VRLGGQGACRTKSKQEGGEPGKNGKVGKEEGIDNLKVE